MNKKSCQKGGEPNAVRVWRGYRANRFKHNPDGFYAALSRIFIPITPQLMAPLGMIAYFPTILKPEDSELADELALVFYEDQKTYLNASRETAAGRAYGMLHGNVFSRKSTSTFPSYFEGSIQIHSPYYLFKNNVNWREGVTQVYIGKIPAIKDESILLQDLAEKIKRFRDDSQSSVDAAIVLVENGYVYYWEHTSKDSSKDSMITCLSTLLTTRYTGTARSINVPSIHSQEESIVDFTPDETLSVYIN